MIYTIAFILIYAGAIYFLAQEKQEPKSTERGRN
jgi:hypothetical protein